MQPALFRVEIPATGEPPSEFRLFRSGLNETIDGRGPFLFDAESARSCMAHAEKWGVDLMVDYEHGSLAGIKLDPSEANKAAAWFRLAVRAGELWAIGVRWTAKAAEKLRAREFRFISPACDFEKLSDGRQRIVKVINAALVNMPALVRQESLMAASARMPVAVASLTPEERQVGAALGIDLAALARFKAAHPHTIKR